MKTRLYKIIYSKKYRLFGALYHGRHCVIVTMAKGRPRNCLVRLKGKEYAVIPYGNLISTNVFVHI